jgi:5-methylcytosine-specific restriction endonuclease McrA
LDKKRLAIYNKFGGKCAYCGSDLNGKFQIDHVIPQALFWNHVRYKKRVPSFLTHLNESDVNHQDNLVPSCQSCNNYKSTMDIETFRGELEKLVERLNKRSTQYKIAKRYGFIEERSFRVEFYFEKFISSENRS